MSSSYAVFSYKRDSQSGESIPIGVALWSSARAAFEVKLVGSEERLAGFDKDDLRFAQLVRDKIATWVAARALPYSTAALEPYDDAWWQHVARLLTHRISLSEPRAVASDDPVKDVGAIYDRTVTKHISREREHVNGAVARGLRELATRFETRLQFDGFGGRPVTITKSYTGARAVVVVEGMNLHSDPERNSDALASKLQRLVTVCKSQCVVIVGYLAPEHGLNGETALVEWVRERVGASVFDLNAEQDAFHEAAGRAIAIADGREKLPTIS